MTQEALRYLSVTVYRDCDRYFADAIDESFQAVGTGASEAEAILDLAYHLAYNIWPSPQEERDAKTRFVEWFRKKREGGSE